MADTEQANGGRTTFRATLVQHLGGALLVVGVVAGAFWAVGSVGDDGDPAPVVADAPEESDEPATDDPGEDEVEDERPEDAEDEEGEDVEAPADADSAPDGEEADDDEPADDPGDDPGDDPSDDEPDDGDNGDAADDGDNGDAADDGDNGDAADDGDDAGADDDPAEGDAPDDGDDSASPEPATDAIDPATVTVQVLDGYQQDGGSAAAAVADQIEAAGYEIIARNPALRYDQTVVLYNAGSEAAARQLAAAIGAAEVREQPGNLSSAVDLHVVVGADRG